MNVVLAGELAIIALALFGISGSLHRIIDHLFPDAPSPEGGVDVGDLLVVRDMEQRVVCRVTGIAEDGTLHIEVVSTPVPTQPVAS